MYNRPPCSSFGQCLPGCPCIAQVHTPLDTQQWQAYLQHHPHADFARYILSELQHGFRIGVRQAAQLHSATTNMLSATQNPQVIRDYLIKELEACNIFGLLNPQAITNLHTSRFGVIPKKHRPVTYL